MSILAICPECSKEYNVPDERAGSKIRCKICRAVIEVEELEESPLIQDKKLKSQKKQKQAAARSKKFQQNMTQVVMILGGMGVLLGIGLTAYLVPAFRETLGNIMFIGGIACFVISWLVIMFGEEELMIRLLIRFFPPAILLSIARRFDEVWPWALLGFGGVVAAISGHSIRC